MNKIQEIIGRLDQATEQVMIESKFIEVTTNDIKDIGVNWASLKDYSVSAGPFERQWTRNRSKSESDTSSSGSTADASTETTSGSINGNSSAVPVVENNEQTVASTFESLSEVASSASTGRVDSALFSASQFEVILSALESQNNVELVANPTVTTLDNTQATIDIAEFFPNPQFTFNAETGQRQLDGVDLEEDGIKVGITLDVTPQVNDAGADGFEFRPHGHYRGKRISDHRQAHDQYHRDGKRRVHGCAGGADGKF